MSLGRRLTAQEEVFLVPIVFVQPSPSDTWMFLSMYDVTELDDKLGLNVMIRKLAGFSLPLFGRQMTIFKQKRH